MNNNPGKTKPLKTKMAHENDTWNNAQDADQCRLDGVEEKNIKFRPSPNHKNMEKHIKQNSKSQSPIDPADQRSHEISPDRNNNSPPGQPPVPRGSPPVSDTSSTSNNPSTLSNPTISGNPSTSGNSAISRSPKTTKRNISEKEHHDNAKVSKLIVCRDYIRGTCKRRHCKYAHKFDLSQLKGVYTFCRYYQNGLCPYPKCRFVHATVFEQGEFYRTGMLPPNAIAPHKTKNKVKLLPPPPPPPPPPSPLPPPPFLYNNNTEIRPAHRYPAIHASRYVPFDAVAGPSGVQLLMAYDNGPTVELDSYGEVRDANWNPAIFGLHSSFVPHEGVAGPCNFPGMQLLMANDNGPNVEQDLCCAASGSPCASAKQKCSNCGVYENKLQHSNQKLEALKSSIQEFDRKIEELDAEKRRMNYVISVLMAVNKDRQPMQNKNNFGPGPSNNGM